MALCNTHKNSKTRPRCVLRADITTHPTEHGHEHAAIALCVTVLLIVTVACFRAVQASETFLLDMKRLIVDSDVDLKDLDPVTSLMDDVQAHTIRACEQVNHLHAKCDSLAETVFQQRMAGARFEGERSSMLREISRLEKLVVERDSRIVVLEKQLQQEMVPAQQVRACMCDARRVSWSWNIHSRFFCFRHDVVLPCCSPSLLVG